MTSFFLRRGRSNRLNVIAVLKVIHRSEARISRVPHLAQSSAAQDVRLTPTGAGADHLQKKQVEEAARRWGWDWRRPRRTHWWLWRSLSSRSRAEAEAEVEAEAEAEAGHPRRPAAGGGRRERRQATATAESVRETAWRSSESTCASSHKKLTY